MPTKPWGVLLGRKCEFDIPIDNLKLRTVAMDWREYVSCWLAKIDSLQLLKQKNLVLYMARGIQTPQGLADYLVDDYVTSRLENTMGHLYELVFEALGSIKVKNHQNDLEGYRGLDFVDDSRRHSMYI